MFSSRLVWLAIIAVAGIAFAFVDISPGNTDDTAFTENCATCHVLPDMQGYGPQDMAPLVARMRTQYDPTSIHITDSEADEVISYLTAAAVANDWQNSYANANLLPIPKAAAGNFVVEVLADQLNFPTSLNFEPSGDLLLLERGSMAKDSQAQQPPALLRYNIDTGEMSALGYVEDADVIPAQRETYNGGAMGLALDADYAVNGRLYICYHHLKDVNNERSGVNRLGAFQVDNNSLQPEALLVDGISAGRVHNGCRVVAGPEGHLFFATGEGNDKRNAQALNSLAGKILRIHTDGSIPNDNPFPDSPIWSLGHRNPQGLAIDPVTGQLWATEHGVATHDELNQILPGKNYGWPYCAGDTDYGELWGGKWTTQQRLRQIRRTSLDFESLQATAKQVWGGRTACFGDGLSEKNYLPAVKSFFPNRSVAISDMVFYQGSAFPAWQGSMFFVTLKTASLVRVALHENLVETTELVIAHDDPANYGRMRDVTVGPDGYLYIITNVTNPAESANARPQNERGGLLLRVRPVTLADGT
ncbi:MAG: PQQ-dependent sugar dehydrogenase [Pseudomonadota bacterium]